MGSPKGGNNNHLTATTASKADLSKLAQNALDTFIASVDNEIDLHDANSVRNAIIGYFEQCNRNGLRVGNLGLYAYLGISKQDYHDMINGKNKSKASPDCIDLMKKATQAIGAYREGLALEGKINPVTYIFMGKNFDNLRDDTHIDITASNSHEANMSPDDIAKQIESDIPIDVTYKE